MTTKIDLKPKNKKIIFNSDDDGEIMDDQSNAADDGDDKNNSRGGSRKKKKSLKKKIDKDESIKESDGGEEEESDDFSFGKKKIKKKDDANDELGQKWYNVYAELNLTADIVELKESEELELRKQCKSAFESLKGQFSKRNPADSKWLNTALQTGTYKDKLNAGALLLTTNPLGNLDILETLIGFTKLSNKSNSEAISVLTDVFQDSLLPSNRKLISYPLRGASWKFMKKQLLDNDKKQKILAYWHFENELKDKYFEFIKNLQHSIQSGQENNKNSCIVSASKLLAYGPEKEQMLLAMLVNKLGDPSGKVASKALHHLTDVVHKHPNMCGVITIETEKLLFRNNITEHAQHFALCYLSQIAPNGHPDVCTKLVNICFSLFKVLVKRGAVNNKTMQAILRCLQKAIIEAKPPAGSTEVMTKEMQDTIYRLVHLADIRISIQTLSLLLQLVIANLNEKTDRFYNALYSKLLDLELATVGNKTMSQFLHILHRAIHLDNNLLRVKAFLKRLLQLSLYMPSNFASGCLIVVNKILKSRHDLIQIQKNNDSSNMSLMADNSALDKFDSDGEEKYEDVKIDDDEIENDEVENAIENVKESTNAVPPTKIINSGWNHTNLVNKNESEKKIRVISAMKYDPYHRVPAFAGSEYSSNTELILFQDHFHPTVKVFSESVINSKKIDYYGDPLKDFSLSHFLERFAFKNPKKITHKESSVEGSTMQQIHQKSYKAHGARGLNIKSLTKSNCPEDELFIFKYLVKKRETQVDKKKDEDEIEDVDDDEFEAYLDGLCKKSSKKVDIELDEEFELDYMKELGADLLEDTSKKSQKRKKAEKEEKEDDDDIWDDGDDAGDQDESADSDLDNQGDDDDEFGGSDGGSISFDDLDNDNESQDEESDEDEPQSKKPRKLKASFDKVLKSNTDMSSLFVAADDFGEILEDNAKSKNHGTSKAIFNTDKSSEKQMKWEEKRHSTYVGKYNKNRNNKFNKKNKSKK